MDCDNNPVVVEVEPDVQKEYKYADEHTEDDIAEPSIPSLPEPSLPGE